MADRAADCRWRSISPTNGGIEGCAVASTSPADNATAVSLLRTSSIWRDISCPTEPPAATFQGFLGNSTEFAALQHLFNIVRNTIEER